MVDLEVLLLLLDEPATLLRERRDPRLGLGRARTVLEPEGLGDVAVEGLSEALAQELPRGLCAVAVNPGVIDTDMLRTAWDEGASAYESPDAWSRRAAPFFLGLGPSDSGRPQTVP